MIDSATYFVNRLFHFGISSLGVLRDTSTMATKKASRSGTAPKKRFVIYHGIKVAPAHGKRSEAAKIIQEELRRRSHLRGERKSA
jgi:hypothetical protein